MDIEASNDRDVTCRRVMISSVQVIQSAIGQFPVGGVVPRRISCSIFAREFDRFARLDAKKWSGSTG
jgi:hypothetical protein